MLFTVARRCGLALNSAALQRRAGKASLARRARVEKSKMKIFFSTPKHFGALTRIELGGAILLLSGASSGHADDSVIGLEITPRCIRIA